MAAAYDALIIGSGPNGLAAAITLARAELSVLVIEARPTIGGGTRSAELTLPGYVHDVCSAIHPLASSSPFFRSVPLESFGLEWIHPEIALAHPLTDGRAAVLHRSVEETAAALGVDGEAYRRTHRGAGGAGRGALRRSARTAAVAAATSAGHGPLRVACVAQGRRLGARNFRTAEARALFAGNAAHGWLPLENRLTAAVGLMLHVSAHHAGWPVAKGGSQNIADAMAAYLRSLGGEIRTGWKVTALAELPKARAILFDTSPQALAGIAADRLPAGYRQRLQRYRHGPAAYKLDLALSEPIPWRTTACRRAGTVHVGGTLEEIAQAEAAIWRGELPARPFMLVGQQSLCDPTRAPAGRHTAWIYAHVPAGFDGDATERAARSRRTVRPRFSRHHPGHPRHATGRLPGVQRQLPRRRHHRRRAGLAADVHPPGRSAGIPTPRPARDFFLCSASTPPGAGVHGMAGWHAARTVLAPRLREVGKKRRRKTGVVDRVD